MLFLIFFYARQYLNNLLIIRNWRGYQVKIHLQRSLLLINSLMRVTMARHLAVKQLDLTVGETPRRGLQTRERTNGVIKEAVIRDIRHSANYPLARVFGFSFDNDTNSPRRFVTCFVTCVSISEQSTDRKQHGKVFMHIAAAMNLINGALNGA